MVDIEVVVSVVGRAVIARELRVVEALEGFGDLVEEKTRFGILRTPRRVRGHHTPVKSQETACCPN